MRKADLRAYEARLHELGERLKGTVDQLDREIAEERTAQGDIAHFGTNNADHDTEFLAVDEAAERNEVKLLNAVEAALASIERGSYGYCGGGAADRGGMVYDGRTGYRLQDRRLHGLRHDARCV